MNKEVIHLEVGPSEDGEHVGFTAYYGDASMPTQHLFKPDVALKLAELLIQAAKELKERGMSDRVQVTESVKMKLN